MEFVPKITYTRLDSWAAYNDGDYGDSTLNFPISSTNALNQPQSVSVNANFGGVTTIWDLNNNPTTSTYDSLGRKIFEQRPDGNYARWAYASCSTCTDGTAFQVTSASYGYHQGVADDTIPLTPVTVVKYDRLESGPSGGGA